VHGQLVIRRSKKLSQYLIGLLIFATGFLSLLFHEDASREVILFATGLFSQDGKVSDTNLSLLKGSTTALSIFLLLFGLLFFISGWKPIINFLNTFWKIINTDPDLTLNRSNRITPILTWGSTVLSLVIVSIKAFEGRLELQWIYGEDRLMENLSFILFFCSAVLLSAAAVRVSKGQLRSVYTFFAGCIFFIALEEISYGQRLFGWETPELFLSRNIQSETNIHNFFNYQFEALYPLMVIFIIPLVLSLYLKLQQQKFPLLKKVLPHPGLFCPICAIAFIALIAGFDQQELIEELFSLLCIFYAARVWLVSGSKPEYIKASFPVQNQ
jgi:hypothetical protein